MCEYSIFISELASTFWLTLPVQVVIKEQVFTSIYGAHNTQSYAYGMALVFVFGLLTAVDWCRVFNALCPRHCSKNTISASPNFKTGAFFSPSTPSRKDFNSVLSRPDVGSNVKGGLFNRGSHEERAPIPSTVTRQNMKHIHQDMPKAALQNFMPDREHSEHKASRSCRIRAGPLSPLNRKVGSILSVDTDLETRPNLPRAAVSSPGAIGSNIIFKVGTNVINEIATANTTTVIADAISKVVVPLICEASEKAHLSTTNQPVDSSRANCEFVSPVTANTGSDTISNDTSSSSPSYACELSAATLASQPTPPTLATYSVKSVDLTRDRTVDTLIAELNIGEGDTTSLAFRQSLASTQSTGLDKNESKEMPISALNVSESRSSDESNPSDSEESDVIRERETEIAGESLFSPPLQQLGSLQGSSQGSNRMRRISLPPCTVHACPPTGTIEPTNQSDVPSESLAALLASKSVAGCTSPSADREYENEMEEVDVPMTEWLQVCRLSIHQYSSCLCILWQVSLFELLCVRSIESHPLCLYHFSQKMSKH